MYVSITSSTAAKDRYYCSDNRLQTPHAAKHSPNPRLPSYSLTLCIFAQCVRNGDMHLHVHVHAAESRAESVYAQQSIQ